LVLGELSSVRYLIALYFKIVHSTTPSHICSGPLSSSPIVSGTDMNLQKKSSQESDIKFPNPPADSISSISINGSAQAKPNMLIATAWDGSVNCYEMQWSAQGQMTNIVPQSQIKHDAPALCSDISSTDNVTVFSGGGDGIVKMWNITQGPTAAQNVGKHDAPIKCLRYVPEKNIVITGSWDKTLKVWDLRQPNPAATLAVTERVYAMDARGQVLVASTADKQIHVYDLNSGGNKVSQFKSPLSYQTRCISIFHDNKGFATGCIEGRIALENFDELQNKPLLATNPAQKPPTKNFAFKCHREAGDVYCVNAIHFHQYNTFASAGSDGVLSFWDKEARHRLANLEMLKKQTPLVDLKFDPTGAVLFYATSYDWSKGAENNDPKIGANIYAHTLLPTEVQPKDPKTLRK